MSTAEQMYVIGGSSILVSDGDHMTITPSTYKNATTAAESGGIITIERLNSDGLNKNWGSYYITGLVDTVDPVSSYLLSSAPYFPAYAPNMHQFEVCVFQKDPDTNLYAKINCFFKDVSTTT